jgi:hypothetical protein
MGSAASHTYRAPEFTDIQRVHDEFITHERERSRLNTMKAVMASLGRKMPNDVDYMSAYTQWLLMTKNANKDGRSMNRWELMKAFVKAQSFF